MIHGHICDWNFVFCGFDKDLVVPLIQLAEPEDGGTMIRSSKKLVTFCQLTWHNIPEEPQMSLQW